MSDPVSPSDKTAGERAQKADAEEKIAQPHAHFGLPADVVVDPALSKEDKDQVLDAMEQDARQLAEADTDGMTEGEGAGLDDVLAAKDALEKPPFELAVEVVLQNLRDKRRAGVMFRRLRSVLP